MNNEEKDGKTRLNWYPGHMAKAKRQIQERMKLVDIIYEVIDARMPKSSKMKNMDNIIKDKPRILIMTKKDLCDMKVTSKWIDFYKKKGYKVLCINLNNNNDYKEIIKTTKELMRPINEKRKEKGLKEKEVKVAVIGIPNVGKSTLINKLANKKIASTANKPGVTKNVSWLNTNNGFLLLDTPGILWPKFGNNQEALCLAGTYSIKTEILNITDIGSYLITFLKNYYPEKLEEKYHIKVDEDLQVTYERLAKRFNFYKNDEIDYEKVSFKVYNDVAKTSLQGVTFDRWK